MPAAAPVLTPRRRQAPGCCVAPAQPRLDAEQTARLAAVSKALGDQTRLRIVDVIREAAPEAVCQCELLPLFDMSQPALAKHLKVLVSAGVLGTERRGLWAYYFLLPDATKELSAWLS
jgi:ArsR family transcriptional regulator, arsenate/arsenite/antimonite-responsive transcriptional repressor